MTGQEQWRDVEGTSGAYQVSDLGRVRSMMRTGTRRDGSSMPVRGCVLKPTIRASGHMVVSLGAGRKEFVHRLVLCAFVGPRPDGMVSRHVDGDPSNNRPHNLAWGTQAENLADMEAHGTKPMGERHGHSKITEADVHEILALSGSMFQREIGERFGISQTMVGRILRGAGWRHVQRGSAAAQVSA